VEAAGGAVSDADGRVLMIRRNDRWDLPKGHVESGETPAGCAVREVAEETGIVAETAGGPLCSTLHCYDIYGRWEMKRTVWFAMRYVSGCPAPQREEGIERVEWLGGEELKNAVASSYPTIRQVFCRLKDVCND
ncbi:MAG: NUDIX domain-containing protein, partial [Alistipes sp.]|nr:NUDIX domain-containing protein [Alistipes sp.]